MNATATRRKARTRPYPVIAPEHVLATFPKRYWDQPPLLAGFLRGHYGPHLPSDWSRPAGSNEDDMFSIIAGLLCEGSMEAYLILIDGFEDGSGEWAQPARNTAANALRRFLRSPEGKAYRAYRGRARKPVPNYAKGDDESNALLADWLAHRS